MSLMCCVLSRLGDYKIVLNLVAVAGYVKETANVTCDHIKRVGSIPVR